MNRRAVPPGSVVDLNLFLKWRQPTRDFEVVQGADGEHFLAMSHGGGLLPSGRRITSLIAPPAGHPTTA
jgi:hypothetical protein